MRTRRKIVEVPCASLFLPNAMTEDYLKRFIEDYKKFKNELGAFMIEDDGALDPDIPNTFIISYKNNRFGNDRILVCYSEVLKRDGSREKIRFMIVPYEETKKFEPLAL